MYYLLGFRNLRTNAVRLEVTQEAPETPYLIVDHDRTIIGTLPGNMTSADLRKNIEALSETISDLFGREMSGGSLMCITKPFMQAEITEETLLLYLHECVTETLTMSHRMCTNVKLAPLLLQS